MAFIETRDGTKLYCSDWRQGPAVVFVASQAIPPKIRDLLLRYPAMIDEPSNQPKQVVQGSLSVSAEVRPLLGGRRAHLFVLGHMGSLPRRDCNRDEVQIL